MSNTSQTTTVLAPARDGAWLDEHGAVAGRRLPVDLPVPRSSAGDVRILFDATVIRAMLVPAVVSLLGQWSWWLQPAPARLLRARPTIPAREGAPA